MTELSPRNIVEELDRYIIGQQDAKKAVAIALRNRWRRKNVPEDIRDEILPKNILMIGSTGVGKTEIARRLAKLAYAPFIKVEATKFTEVGYVGRDVESIIRDLTEFAITMVRNQMRKEVEEKARAHAEDRVLDSLVGESASDDTRNKFREMLREGKLNDKEIEIQVQDNGNSAFPSFDIPGMPGSSMGVLNISDMLGKAIGGAKMKSRRMSVGESYDILIAEECDKMIDEEVIVKKALLLVENDGIVFIDEIDKVAARSDVKGGEVSREGVQRDLLPLTEGTSVTTKYGTVNTDHILFIASGAFHLCKPPDLLPELQGRLPIRVELKSLNRKDMIRILKEPKYSLLKQYTALMKTEGVDVIFHDDGVERIAQIAADLNKSVENIGARRLHTIMEKLMEEVSYDANEMNGVTVEVNTKYVDDRIGDLTEKADLSRFIL
ncbi:MAG: ATP-dependent protease ATPase subunit HslU [Rickettsiales bacterium]|nr:ATP-dependent protease ATPase subunit HslU [Rickettsiales bacterium]